MWNTGATSQAITATSTGMYSVVASNGSCQGSDEVDLVFLPSPTDVLVDHTSCIDQPVTLNAGNSGCTFLWNTSETTQQITPAQSGTYSVIVTNSANCSVTFDASVTYVNYPIVDLGPDTSLCAGDVLDLDAGNAGSTFNWSNGAHTQIVPVMNNGTYSVSVDNGYCVSSDSIHATFRPRPSHMDMHDYFTCLDQDPHYVVIDAGNGAGNGGSFDWSNGETHQVILAGAYGWYFVNITNQFNCTTRDSANVHEFCPASIYVPNTFTPNGDGVNDVWLPVGNNIGSYDLNLFDRWGNVIFHSESPSFGWDGTINGEPAPNDVYVWRMEYKFIEKVDGTEGFLQKQMGHVTVMR